MGRAYTARGTASLDKRNAGRIDDFAHKRADDIAYRRADGSANRRVDDSAYRRIDDSANRRVDIIAHALAEILDQETALYKDASDISAKKTDVIVHGKIEELDVLVKAEQAIILKIGRLEDERERIVRALSDELELDLGGVTLSQISERLGKDSFSRLDNCHKKLAATLGGLKNSNETNAQLIRNALDYVNFSVNLLTTSQSSGSLYTQAGQDESARPNRNVFDVKL